MMLKVNVTRGIAAALTINAVPAPTASLRSRLTADCHRRCQCAIAASEERPGETAGNMEASAC
jgi:hypothetical protein